MKFQQQQQQGTGGAGWWVVESSALDFMFPSIFPSFPLALLREISVRPPAAREDSDAAAV
jgi:hypothetical protein